MKKMFSKCMSVLLAAAMIFSFAQLAPNIRASAAESGACGENLTWTLDDKGTLTISGTGEMYDYDWMAPAPFYILPVKDVIISDGITSIGKYAFYDCSFKNITIPESVVSIGEDAFNSCYDLTSVTIPGSVASIGDYAFCGCFGLTSITFPSGVTSIGSFALEGCYKLTSVTISDSVASIGSAVLNGCNNLREITVSKENENYCDVDGVLFSKDMKTLVALPPKNAGERFAIPDSVTHIAERALNNCSDLKEITLPDSVASIGDSAFYNCTGLTEIVIPDSVTFIDEGAFSSCFNLKNVKLSNNITSISDYMFGNCNALENITIPEGVTSIGKSAFDNCHDLKNIKIPEGVASVGEYAFYACHSLAGMEIPDSVTYIGDSAFMSCSDIADITISENVAFIGENAFSYCEKLTKINVSEKNTNYCDIDGVLFSKDKKTLLWYPYSKTGEYWVPDGTAAIGPYAFRNSNLTNIKFPQSLVTICDNAFWACNMTEIILPDTVTSIGQSAFESSNITTLNIPGGVTYINESTFQFCPNLKSVIIPDSVTGIGVSAFYEVPGLSDIYYGGSEEQWNNITIENLNFSLENATIHFNANIGALTRLSGPSRYDTAVAISNKGWESAETVVLANSMSYADALAGVPYAYQLDAPILLTAGKATLEPTVMAQIEKLSPKKIVILGGKGVISNEIKAELEKKYTVERVSGTDRYLTAVEISKRVNATPETAIIVTGTGYADALSISPYAALKKFPIVYSNPKTALTKETLDYLKPAKNILIIGGPGAVGENTVKQLDGKSIERLRGSDRYLTSFAIVDKFQAEFGNDVMLATGVDFPDALAGGVLAAKLKTPLLLTHPSGVNDEIKNYILGKSPENIYILGGKGAMPDSIVENIYK